MDDAALGLACTDLTHPPAWISVRNASDPQMTGGNITTEKANAAKIYEQYGYWTSIGSAITCWALTTHATAKPSEPHPVGDPQSGQNPTLSLFSPALRAAQSPGRSVGPFLPHHRQTGPVRLDDPADRLVRRAAHHGRSSIFAHTLVGRHHVHPFPSQSSTMERLNDHDTTSGSGDNQRPPTGTRPGHQWGLFHGHGQ